MAQYVNGNTKTFLAGEALEAFRRVKLDTTTAGQVVYADAGDPAIGVTETVAASGANVAVRLNTAAGTMKVECAGAVSIGDAIYGAADGKVDDDPQGSAFGVALSAATADGDVIESMYGTELQQAAGASVEVIGGAGDITALDLVYVSDQTGDIMTVLPAQSTSAGRFADYICPNAITATARGVALKHFLLSGINTSAGSVGDPVYLSDATAGGYTLTKPTATDKVQIVGRIVEDHASTGAILFDLSGPQQVTHDHSSDAEGGSALGAHSSGTITLDDEANIVVNTTTGTEIGTAAGQKIGFWGTTPTTQPSHVADPASAAAMTQDTLTDNGGGTADGTVASMAAPTTITDSTGYDGTHNDTLAATAAITTITDSSGYDGTHNDAVAAMAAITTITDSSGLSGTHDDTVAAITNTDTLTDSSGGTADDTVAANSSVSVFTIPIADMTKLANGEVVTEFVPGFAGTILKAFWIQEDPVTTADKLGTLNLEIETTNVDGGVIALTSAACTPIGKVIEGTAVTANNVFTSAQKISVEASSVTAFIEGTGTIVIVVSNDSVDDNFKEVADQLATQRTLNGVLAQNQSDVSQKVIELITREVVHAQNISDVSQKIIELVARDAVHAQNVSDLGQKVIEIITLLATIQNNMKEVTTQLAKIKTDVAAVRTGSEANNTSIDSILAQLATTGLQAAS